MKWQTRRDSGGVAAFRLFDGAMHFHFSENFAKGLQVGRRWSGKIDLDIVFEANQLNVSTKNFLIFVDY